MRELIPYLPSSPLQIKSIKNPSSTYKANMGTCACCRPGYWGSWGEGRAWAAKRAAWSPGWPWKTKPRRLLIITARAWSELLVNYPQNPWHHALCENTMPYVRTTLADSNLHWILFLINFLLTVEIAALIISSKDDYRCPQWSHIHKHKPK